jgi:hypothetical protein
VSKKKEEDLVEVVVSIPRSQLQEAGIRAVGRVVPENFLYQKIVPRFPELFEDERLLLIENSRRRHCSDDPWSDAPEVKTIFLRRRKEMVCVHHRESSDYHDTARTLCLLEAHLPPLKITKENEVRPIPPSLARYGEGHAMGHQYDDSRGDLWSTKDEKDVTCTDCLAALAHARKKAAEARGLPYRERR